LTGWRRISCRLTNAASDAAAVPRPGLPGARRLDYLVAARRKRHPPAGVTPALEIGAGVAKGAMKWLTTCASHQDAKAHR